MTDHLAGLPIEQVEGWYRRLAARPTGHADSMSNRLLQIYLDNRDPRFVASLPAPPHLIRSDVVAATLRFHRGVFLSEQRFGGRWVGIAPRLRGGHPTPWDLTRPLVLSMNSLCDIAPNVFEIVRIQRFGSWQERDILASLRGCQLHSRAEFTGRRLGRSNCEVRVQSWMAWATDRYDWNYSEHFTVPNPDFGSAAPDAVRPQDEELTVYHSNARRLERAGRAAPYDIQTHEWAVTTASLLETAIVHAR